MIQIFLLLSCLITIIVIFRSVIKPKKFPPGPKWYPFIGSSNVVNKFAKKYGSQWKAMSVLAKNYSTDVLGLKLGGERVVIVYGQKNIRQVFTEREFEGRPDNFFIRMRCLGTKMGITFADGNIWKEQRQFTVRQLKNVGLGKSKMEIEIQKELSSIVKYLEDIDGAPIKAQTLLVMSVMNVLWTYVAGERLEEKRVHYMLDLFSARSQAFTITGGLLNHLPWLRFILPDTTGYTIIKKLNEQLSHVIKDAIDKHKKNMIDGTDFMYAYLDEIKTNKEGYTEMQLILICLDILIAGLQTTSHVLEFALLTLLRYKDIQKKLYDEINENLQGNTPSWTDSSRLVYTSAFLQEVHRYYIVIPLMGPRRTLEDTYIDGYIVPQDTTVLLAIGDLHHDPEIWSDPGEFKPERFIDESGALKNVEHLYPFGLGRRRCPGDALAKSFIFIVLVGILQKFRIECQDGVVPSGVPIFGLISRPAPYLAVFTPRGDKS